MVPFFLSQWTQFLLSARLRDLLPSSTRFGLSLIRQPTVVVILSVTCRLLWHLMFDTWKKAWKGKRHRDGSPDDPSEGSGSRTSLVPEALETREREIGALEPVHPIQQSAQNDVSAELTSSSSQRSGGQRTAIPRLPRRLLSIASSTNQEEVKYHVVDETPSKNRRIGQGASTQDEVSGRLRLDAVHGSDATRRARDENSTLKLSNSRP